MGPPVVAISALNATDNPGPGVAVARALRADPDWKGRLIGLAYDTYDPGVHIPGLFDAVLLMPYPSQGRRPLLDRLAYGRELHGIDVLIPNLDAELPIVVGAEEELARLGIRTVLPTKEQLDLRSKARLAELGATHDLSTPRTEVLLDVGAMADVIEKLGLPIVVKGVFYGAEICRSLPEAWSAFHRQVADWGLPVIVQEHIVGEELNVCVVGDGQGGVVGAVAMKKLMLTKAGKGWIGVTIHDPKLLDLARRTVEALRWRGPCEVEVIRSVDGRYLIIEVNPRFPAWCDLCAGAGANLPRAVVDWAMEGRPSPVGEGRSGIAFVRVSIDQILPISALEELAVTGQVDLSQRPRHLVPLAWALR